MIRRVLATTVKEILQLKRDWRTALALLAMTVVLLMIYGYALSPAEVVSLANAAPGAFTLDRGLSIGDAVSIAWDLRGRAGSIRSPRVPVASYITAQHRLDATKAAKGIEAGSLLRMTEVIASVVPEVNMITKGWR